MSTLKATNIKNESSASNNIVLNSDGGTYVSGNIGIGNTNPQYTLDVTGDINLTGTFRQNGSTFVASRWTSGIGNDIYRLNGDVGIGTTNPTTALQVVGVVSATSYLGDGSQLSGISLGTDITSCLFT